MSRHQRVAEQAPLGREGPTLGVYRCECCKTERLRHNFEESIWLDCLFCDPGKTDFKTVCGIDLAAPGADKTVTHLWQPKETAKANRPSRHHASKAIVIGLNKLPPADMVWLGRALQALTELNLHIPCRLTLVELRATVKRIHTQAWQCVSLIQKRPLSEADRARHKSRLFTLANKLKGLL